MERLTYEDKKPKEMRRGHGVCDIPFAWTRRSPSGLKSANPMMEYPFNEG
jgi:hypothetical protein